MRQGDTETATSIIPSSCSSTEALGTSGLVRRRHQGFPLSSQGPPEGPPQARNPCRGVKWGSFSLGWGAEGRAGAAPKQPGRAASGLAPPPGLSPAAQHKKKGGGWTPKPPKSSQGRVHLGRWGLVSEGMNPSGVCTSFLGGVCSSQPHVPPSPGTNGKRERPEGRCSGQIRRERAPSLTSTGGGKRRGSDRSTADPLLPCNYRSYRG